LIGLAAIIHAESTLERPRTEPIWISTLAFLALGLLIPYGFCAADGFAAMRAGSANNWLGRSAVLFSRAFDTGGTIKKTIYPSPLIVRREAMVLDDLGLIQPALVKTNDISSIHHWSADGRNATGWCESIVPSGSETLLASGWAVLNAAGRPADGVVFTYEFPERSWILFCHVEWNLGSARHRRPDAQRGSVLERMGSDAPAERISSWRTHLSVGHRLRACHDLPPG